MNIPIILTLSGLAGLIGTIALLGSWAADELEKTEAAGKKPVEPIPGDCAGRICAWCHPGVNCEAGHGICPQHAEEMRRSFQESQSEGGA